jgi:hypothetical protein
MCRRCPAREPLFHSSAPSAVAKRKYKCIKGRAVVRRQRSPARTRRTGHNHLPLHQQPQHTTTTTTLSPPTTPPTKLALEIGLFRVRRRSRQLLDERHVLVGARSELESREGLTTPDRKRTFECCAQLGLNRTQQVKRIIMRTTRRAEKTNTLPQQQQRDDLLWVQEEMSVTSERHVACTQATNEHKTNQSSNQSYRHCALHALTAAVSARACEPLGAVLVKQEKPLFAVSSRHERRRRVLASESARSDKALKHGRITQQPEASTPDRT